MFLSGRWWQQNAFTSGCVQTTAISFICQSIRHLHQSAGCLKIDLPFTLNDTIADTQHNQDYKMEQVLELKMCWFDIKTVVFAFKSNGKLDDKTILCFKAVRSRNRMHWDRRTCWCSSCFPIETRNKQNVQLLFSKIKEHWLVRLNEVITATTYKCWFLKNTEWC